MDGRSAAAALLILGMGVAPRARAAEVVVVQKDKAFLPRSVTIQPGDVVIFKNEDAVTHNAFSETTGLEFNLKAEAPGATDTVRFEHEGTADVRCAFHPAMRLQITVKK